MLTIIVLCIKVVGRLWAGEIDRIRIKKKATNKVQRLKSKVFEKILNEPLEEVPRGEHQVFEYFSSNDGDNHSLSPPRKPRKTDLCCSTRKLV